MTEIQLEMPDQKRKPHCYIQAVFTLADGANVQPLTYEQARHRGVTYYDRERWRRLDAEIRHCRRHGRSILTGLARKDYFGRDHAGRLNDDAPPSWIGESFGRYRWDYDRRDYVLVDNESAARKPAA